MSGFGGGVPLDLVNFEWFQVARGGCDQYSGRFDMNSTLILPRRVQFRHYFGTILTFLLISGSSSLHVNAHFVVCVVS